MVGPLLITAPAVLARPTLYEYVLLLLLLLLRVENNGSHKMKRVIRQT